MHETTKDPATRNGYSTPRAGRCPECGQRRPTPPPPMPAELAEQNRRNRGVTAWQRMLDAEWARIVASGTAAGPRMTAMMAAGFRPGRVGQYSNGAYITLDHGWCPADDVPAYHRMGTVPPEHYRTTGKGLFDGHDMTTAEGRRAYIDANAAIEVKGWTLDKRVSADGKHVVPENRTREPEPERYDPVLAAPGTTGQWLRDAVTPDEAGTPAGELFTAYQKYCAQQGIEADNATVWGRALSEAGYAPVHGRTGKRRRLRVTSGQGNTL